MVGKRKLRGKMLVVMQSRWNGKMVIGKKSQVVRIRDTSVVGGDSGGWLVKW